MNLYNNQIALIVNNDLVIQNIILNTYQRFYVEEQESLISLLDQSSIPVLHDLSKEKLSNNSLISKRIKLRNKVEAFLFSIQFENTITVLIISIHDEITEMFDEMLEINSTYNNTLRDLYKRLVGASSELELLEEIMKLNNELLNTKRDLIINNNKLQQLNKQLEDINDTDFLTNIYNRRKFLKDVYRFVKREEHILLMLDINNFKIINDVYGHVTGDECLILFATKLKEYAITYHGFVYRLGGDEFALLIPRQYQFDIKEMIDKITKDIQTFDQRIGIAYGHVYINDETVNNMNRIEDSMHKADLLMYEVKNLFYQKNNMKRK